MEDQIKKLKLFAQLKQSTLGKEDLSLKGSIDDPIRPLVELINKDDYYYTTSTCSGRITITEKPVGRSNIKKGNKFIYTSHSSTSLEDLKGTLDSYILDEFTSRDELDQSTETCLWLKFEPFIMHIQCYDLDKAKSILSIALATGCRNSGITLGKPDKFMVAFRSTSSMECPIYCCDRLGSPVGFGPSMGYLRFLQDECNRRMSDNMERLAKLQSALESFLDQEKAKAI